MPVADKLRALVKHRHAWQKLDWTSKTVVDLPASLHTGRACELVAGMLAFQEDGPDIYTLTLQEDSRVTKHVLGIDPHTYVRLTMDPTQDLLAVVYRSGPAFGFVSHNLALRALSANQPHPMARRPTILVETGREELEMVVIADDVVGISFGAPGSIRVWNWRTGALLADVRRVHTIRPDFQFISPRVFVTASPTDSGWIDIFMILPEKAPDSEGAVHVTRLRFPELEHADGLSLWNLHAVSIYAGPVYEHPLPGSFIPKNENRIFFFVYRLASTAGETRWMRLMIHHDTLAVHLSRYGREGRTEYLDVKWEDWGPRDTRILAGDRSDWLVPGTAHGERVVNHVFNRQQLQVLDFRPIPGDPKNNLSEDNSRGFVLGSSTIQGAPFKDPVTTYLPFRCTLLATDDEFDTILMDHEHIIVAEEHSNKITVFKF
ncbi:hypothetical protein FB45DRAFT_1109371 [Roridomyces roridus]|uniref:Uncharacterized protein n=1 Tax=Roridomyces roridus TaxID=1738132 RepID=A0AAD7BAE0_9AGAR|nr:hypothetical protein FB45DRAFT_1109371 [Roridomyces roridus]